MTTVTLYTRPGCGACIFTERALELAGIPYWVLDVDADEGAGETAQRVNDELKTKQLPVVVCDDGRAWSGLRLDLIAELVREADEVRRAWLAQNDTTPYPWNGEGHELVLERIE